MKHCNQENNSNSRTERSDIRQKVYEYLTRIPQGKVVTYGQIARALGNPGLARAVGNILHVNLDPIGHPCFRVVNRNGCLAAHFGDGIEVQRERLLNDGIEVVNDSVDLKKYQWNEGETLIKEKSCGAVIFATFPDGVRYLVETMQKGHFSNCKGHVEGNETEIETATREIREETGLAVRFIDGFREVISYSPYSGCMKDVVFFLAEAQGTETTAQEIEVRTIEWLPFSEAFRKMTFETDKSVLACAEAFRLGTQCHI